MIGEVYGSLTVIDLAESKRMPSGGIKKQVKVRCECSNETIVQVNNLRSGRTVRCQSCKVSKRNRMLKKTDDSVNKFQCYRNYERGAQKRGFVFELSLAQFTDITQNDCVYCCNPPSNTFNLKYSDTGLPRAGLPFVYNGVDRIDSTKGYSVENCVACCINCNRSKSDMSLEEFKDWLTRAYHKTIGE